MGDVMSFIVSVKLVMQRCNIAQRRLFLNETMIYSLNISQYNSKRHIYGNI